MYYTIQANNKLEQIPKFLPQTETQKPEEMIEKPQPNINIYQDDFPTIHRFLSENYTYQPSISETIMEAELTNQESSKPQIPNIKQSLKEDILHKDLRLLQQFIPDGLNRIIQGPMNIKYGNPIRIVASGAYIILATERGCVYAINLQEQSQDVTIVDSTGQEYRYKLIELVTQQQSSAGISMISFDPKEQILGVGYANGSLLFVNFQKPSKQKANKESHSSKITILLNIDEKLWISCEESGHVIAHRLEKGTFNLNLNSQELVNVKLQTIKVLKTNYQIKYFAESRQKSFLTKPQELVSTTPMQQKDDNYVVLAMASYEKCWIIRMLDYNVAQMLVIIDNLQPASNCCLEWVESTDSLYLFIIWGSQMNQYKLEKIEQKSTTNLLFNIENVIQLPSQVIFIRSDNKNIVTLINNNGMVSIYTFLKDKIINLFSLPLKIYQISVNDELKEIYFFNQSILMIKEYSFQEIFQHLLEKNDIETCQQLLLYGKLLAVDSQQFNQRLMEFVSKKIQIFIRSPKPLEEYLYQLINFLLQLEEEDLLYKQVYVTITSYMGDNGSFFLESLMKFIQNKNIIYIPEQQLVKIVEGLVSRGKINILETLLMTLDPSRTNQSLLMHYCMENSLLKPMIQLCTLPGKDGFLTPLFQLYNYCTRYYGLKEYTLCRYYGLRSQAYILLCLQDIKPYDLEMLIDFLFEKNALREFITMDPKSCFQILGKVFYITTIHLVEFTHKDNLQYIIDAVQEINNHKTYKYFTLFILTILLKQKIQISMELLLQVVQFIIDFPETYFLIDPDSYFECIDRPTFTYLSNETNSVELMEYIHQKFIMQLIHRLEYRDPINDTICGLKQSDLDLVAAYLNTEQNQIERAFDILLKSNSRLIRRSVFPWLDKLFEQQISIMDLVIDRLTDLIQLDLERTWKILRKQEQDFESQILLKLEKHPKLQLEYLDYIVHLSKKQYKLLKYSILKQHILMLSQLAPHRLIEELHQSEYPLDEVLKISLEYGNIEAQAYVYERHGAIYEAIMIHLGILKNIFNDILTKINEYELVSLKQYKLANVKINQIMEICVRNTNFDTSEDNWYSFLDFFIDYSKLLDKHDPKQATAYFYIFKKLDSIFEQISIHTPLDIFVQSLEERYGQLKIYDLRETFVKIMFNFYYQKNFIDNLLSFLKEGYKKEYFKGLAKQSQGYPVYAFCDYCGLNLSSGQAIIIFYCGHQLHWQCNKDPTESRCRKCLQQDLGVYENLASDKQKRMKKLFDKGPIVNRQYSIRKIKNQDIIKVAPPTDKILNRKEQLKQYDSNRSNKVVLKMP